VHLNVINGLLDGSPIYNGDFADPAAIHVGLDVYIYASDTVTAHIPVLEASPTTDYIGTYLGDALPTLPSWIAPGLQWAPAVWARPDGTYVIRHSVSSYAHRSDQALLALGQQTCDTLASAGGADPGRPERSWRPPSSARARTPSVPPSRWPMPSRSYAPSTSRGCEHKYRRLSIRDPFIECQRDRRWRSRPKAVSRIDLPRGHGLR
jgi:hypothetical protein